MRLVALVGHDRAAGVTVATFHALCARLLRPHAHLFGRSSAFSIYDQSDVVRIVGDLLADDHRAAATKTLASRRRRADRARQEPPGVTEACAVEGHGDGARLAALWERVDAELAACNAFDFADLVTYGVRLLREHPPIRDAYRRRWRHVLVDEFQDTDPAQLALLAALSGPSGGAPQRVAGGRRRRRPGGLRLARSGGREPARLRALVSLRRTPRAVAKLPLSPGDPRRRDALHRPQHPPPAQGAARRPPSRRRAARRGVCATTTPRPPG